MKCFRDWKEVKRRGEAVHLRGQWGHEHLQGQPRWGGRVSPLRGSDAKVRNEMLTKNLYKV